MLKWSFLSFSYKIRARGTVNVRGMKNYFTDFSTGEKKGWETQHSLVSEYGSNSDCPSRGFQLLKLGILTKFRSSSFLKYVKESIHFRICCISYTK